MLWDYYIPPVTYYVHTKSQLFSKGHLLGAHQNPLLSLFFVGHLLISLLY